MGASSSSKVKDIDPKDMPMKFVMQGLPYAGKTSLLHKLKYGDAIEHNIATMAVDLQVFQHDGLKVAGWDYASRSFRRRVLSRSYYRASEGLIYVIDSALGMDKLGDSINDLNEIIKENEEAIGDNLVVMVVANKQDLENAVGAEEIQRELKDKCCILQRVSLCVMLCSVETGEGVHVALDLFVKMVKMKREGKLCKGLVENPLEIVNLETDKEKFTKTGDVTEHRSTKILEDEKQNSMLKDIAHILKLFYFTDRYKE